MEILGFFLAVIAFAILCVGTIALFLFAAGTIFWWLTGDLVYRIIKRKIKEDKEND